MTVSAFQFTTVSEALVVSIISDKKTSGADVRFIKILLEDLLLGS